MAKEKRTSERQPRRDRSKTFTKANSNASKSSLSALRRKLERAADGLEYLSEADYPFRFFMLSAEGEDPLTPESFLKLLGVSQELIDDLNLTFDQFIEERTIDDFFKGLTDPSDPEEAPAAKRFRRLVAVLKKELQDVKVFRVGQVEIRCYIAGLHGESDIAGLVTTAVET